jgi:hypothetical protein
MKLSWLMGFYGLWTLSFAQAPHFLIIGAQKAGTTSLHKYISEHPRVRAAARKEMHFFDLNFEKGLSWYLECFPSLEPGYITGDASPYYLVHPLVPQRVQKLFPDIKLIILLRDPVERTISHYKHSKYKQHESLSFEDALSQESQRLAGEYEELMHNPDYKSYSYRHYSYKERSRYVEQLQRWFSFFSREQFLIIKSEDLFTHPREVTNQVFSFLGLEPYRLPAYPHYNKTSYFLVVDKDLRVKLATYFKPYNQALKELVGISWD